MVTSKSGPPERSPGQTLDHPCVPASTSQPSSARGSSIRTRSTNAGCPVSLFPGETAQASAFQPGLAAPAVRPPPPRAVLRAPCGGSAEPMLLTSLQATRGLEASTPRHWPQEGALQGLQARRRLSSKRGGLYVPAWWVQRTPGQCSQAASPLCPRSGSQGPALAPSDP